MTLVSAPPDRARACAGLAPPTFTLASGRKPNPRAGMLATPSPLPLAVHTASLILAPLLNVPEDP